MRAALEKWLTGVWYAEVNPPWVLRQLESIYRLVLPKTAQNTDGLTTIPVVVVGNITVGGTGKTPLVIALCKQLQVAGFKPAVISRGYGRKSKGLHSVNINDMPSVCGDESLLIKRETGVPVVLAEDRRLAVAALAELDVNIIIADDGLQNTHLNRDYEICLIDGERQLGNGHLLPAGPLREPASRLGSVDCIVVNGDSVQLKEFERCYNSLGLPIHEFVMSMELLPAKLESLEASAVDRISSDFHSWEGKTVHAVAAIGNPMRFCKTLQALGMQPLLHAFPDHHQFRAEDLSQMQDFPIIMTSKDAIKCTSLGLDNAWVLSVDAAINADAWTGLISDITSLIDNHQEKSK